MECRSLQEDRVRQPAAWHQLGEVRKTNRELDCVRSAEESRKQQRRGNGEIPRVHEPKEKCTLSNEHPLQSHQRRAFSQPVGEYTSAWSQNQYRAPLHGSHNAQIDRITTKLKDNERDCSEPRPLVDSSSQLTQPHQAVVSNAQTRSLILWTRTSSLGSNPLEGTTSTCVGSDCSRIAHEAVMEHYLRHVFARARGSDASSG